MSGIMNKAKDMVDKAIHPEHKNTTTTTTTGGVNDPHSTNAGPHQSNIANKADPRVDSDMDGSRNAGASTGASGFGTGVSGTGTGLGHGHGHNTGTSTGSGSGYDPTRTTGTGVGSGTTGAGYDSGAHGSTNAGPYSSNIANKLDPRVDSDMDGSRNAGMSSGHGANTHGGYGSQTTGPHSTNVGNVADPRVDSDNSTGAYGGHHSGISSTTGTGTSGTRTAGLTGGLTGTEGTGPAPNTAGPYKSDMMNKIDPRVDSDLDGSKTVGGNKTYTGAFDGSAEPSMPSTGSSPPDAATHGPSAFRDKASEENLPADSDHNRRHSLVDTKNILAKYGPGHK